MNRLLAIILACVLTLIARDRLSPQSSSPEKSSRPENLAPVAHQSQRDSFATGVKELFDHLRNIGIAITVFVAGFYVAGMKHDSGPVFSLMWPIGGLTMGLSAWLLFLPFS